MLYTCGMHTHSYFLTNRLYTLPFIALVPAHRVGYSLLVQLYPTLRSVSDNGTPKFIRMDY